MAKILIIEDDTSLGSNLRTLLKNEGYECSLAINLEEANQYLNSDFELIILDWMLPDGQGIDFLKKMRQDADLRPVIMLTARVELIDKILGLESGANDYLTKPFEPRELLARIRVQLRQPINTLLDESEENIIVGDISINEVKREVLFKKNIIEMTKMEYELLLLLISNVGRVFSREEILNKVWGYENYPSTRTVDTHILQLRQKLSGEYIDTIRGIGYRLNKL